MNILLGRDIGWRYKLGSHQYMGENENIRHKLDCPKWDCRWDLKRSQTETSEISSLYMCEKEELSKILWTKNKDLPLSYTDNLGKKEENQKTEMSWVTWKERVSKNEGESIGKKSRVLFFIIFIFQETESWWNMIISLVSHNRRQSLDLKLF